MSSDDSPPSYSEKISNWGNSPIPFIPGLELSERYYQEAVQPILERNYPGLKYSAGLLGYGSDVMGFDTPMSRDHLWGPRLLLFLPEENFSETHQQVLEKLRQELPLSFYGYPTHFSDPDAEGTRVMEAAESGPVDHLIFAHNLSSFLVQELGFDRSKQPIWRDWLTFGEQSLIRVTAGSVFHDDLGLEEIRQRFQYYPRDVWLYLLASQWRRISQEEAFVGRTGDLGDDLGSAIIAARLVNDLMRLGFLMEQRYAPYSKWLGVAFQRLQIAEELTPLLEKTLNASTWKDREVNLSQAYRIAANRHNLLGITPALEAETVNFYGRPFQVLFADRFAGAIRVQIQDETLRKLPLYGSVNQFCTTVDILTSPEACKRLEGLYQILISSP